MRPIRSLLAATTAVVAGTILLTAGPATAAPATSAVFYGTAFAMSPSSALQQAYGDAFRQAAAAGYSANQCPALGTPLVEGISTEWLAQVAVQCTR